MSTKFPNIYVDTNVIRDCIKGRKHSVIQMMGKIKEKNCKCFTSAFTIMEFIDIEKDEIYFHKKVRIGWDMNQIIRGRMEKKLTKEELEEANERAEVITKQYGIEFLNLHGDGWDLASWLSSVSNIQAADIIHLATAWQSKCNLIVTSDEFFIKEASIILEESGVLKELRICRPEDTDKMIFSPENQNSN
jgi:predicted nucleic acid-binding protein